MLAQKLRSIATSGDTLQRTKAKELIEQVLLTQSKSLVQIQTDDLHVPLDTAKDNVR